MQTCQIGIWKQYNTYHHRLLCRKTLSNLLLLNFVRNCTCMCTFTMVDNTVFVQTQRKDYIGDNFERIKKAEREGAIGQELS